jgi:hypothetical protein
MNAQISPKDWQLLSEYLDGQLSPHDRSKLELRIDSRPELRDGLEELRRLRSILRTVPRRKVPHNFTLTRAMVEKPAASRWTSWIPALSFSSAMATFLLIISLLTRMPAGLPATMVSPGSEAERVMMVEPEAAIMHDAQEAPPIIVWEAPGFGGMGGGNEGLMAEGRGGMDAPDMGLMAMPEEEFFADEGMPAPAEEYVYEEPAEEPAEAPSVAAAPPVEEPSASLDSKARIDENIEPLVGTGPILGVAPVEEQGAMNLKSAAPDTIMLQEDQQQAAQPDSTWLILQIGLVLVAIGTGIAALYLRRKAKA